jgi:hypothetical protein
MADKNNVYIGRKGIVFIDGERFPKRDFYLGDPQGPLVRQDGIC